MAMNFWRFSMKTVDPFKWVKPHIERISCKWAPRGKVLNNARRVSQLPDKRTKWEYQCNGCKEWFKKKYIQLDHIVPKGKYSKETFFVWLDKLFCPASGFQVLCIPCHKQKSATEHATGEYK